MYIIGVRFQTLLVLWTNLKYKCFTSSILWLVIVFFCGSLYMLSLTWKKQRPRTNSTSLYVHLRYLTYFYVYFYVGLINSTLLPSTKVNDGDRTRAWRSHSPMPYHLATSTILFNFFYTKAKIYLCIQSKSIINAKSMDICICM